MTPRPNGLISRYKAAHNRGTRQVRRRPFIVPILGLVFGLGVVVATFLLERDNEALRPSDAHVVFLSDGARRDVLGTKAKTVGDLIANLTLNLSEQDVVEPSLDTPIVEDNFRVNIYRARPVVVIDSNKNKTITLTAQKSARVVAQKAGLKVYPEDEVTFAQGSLLENIIGEKVVVNRALKVVINLYGENLPVRTRAGTVAELLKEKEITVNKNDTLRPNESTKITPGIQVAVIRNGTHIKVVRSVIPAPEQYVEDSRLSFGATAVRQEGSPGSKAVTYQIKIKKGKIISRKIIQQVIDKKPVPRIIARGIIVDIAGNKTSIMAAAGIKSGDYGYVNFIISHESNWNPGARNAGGCLGLGQACPGSKLTAVCPDLNATCQLKFFSGYAQGRYGSWSGAYSFWQSAGYW